MSEMQVEVKYPYEDIDSERAEEYLHEIDSDIFNGDTTLEDLEELNRHLPSFIKAVMKAQGLIKPTGPYVSPGGYY